MNCQEATQKLEALQMLREQLGKVILAYKESETKGDTAKAEELKQYARNLKQELETGIKEMNKEMLTFVVSDAVNPHREGLIEAGLPIDHPLCAEKKEMILDIEEIIQEQTVHYREQNLPEWAEDIVAHKDLLLDIILDYKEQKKITKRIKAGMIPIVMPGRETQQKTWRKSLENLKPIWIQDGEKQAVDITHIDEEGYDEKMPQFLESLPDRPYLVWVKPTRTAEKIKPKWKTTDLSFEDQRQKLKKLRKDHPDFVDEKDIIPTEYAALQSSFTAKIQGINTRHNPYYPYNCIENISPLDYWNNKRDNPHTQFLSAGLTSDFWCPSACFQSDDEKMQFDMNTIGDHGDPNYGFRPVARS